MRQRNTGTLALTAGLCLLAMACGDSDSMDEDGDGVAVPVGEAADGVLLSNPPPPDPWQGNPGSADPANPSGYYDPWGYGAPGGYGGPWGGGYGNPWGGGYGSPWGGAYGDPWGGAYGGPWGGGAWGQGTLGGYGGPWGGGYGSPWGGAYGGPWGGYGGPWGGANGGGYGGPSGGGYGPQSMRTVQSSMGAGLEPGVSTIPWVSPWRGGGVEGTDYVVSCDPGRIAVGFFGRAHDFIDRIGLVCAEVLPGGVLGEQDLYGPVGGEGGEYFIDKCPDGYAVAGLAGRADLLVNQLRLVCDKVAPVPLLFGPMFGGVGGKEWSDVSPGGFFMVEVRGRSGDQIEGLQSVHRFVKA